MSKIILATSSTQASQRWLPVMQAALPDHELHVWEAGSPPIGARYAIVWSPPDAVFQAEREVQAIFNLGAGVDALLNLPSLPDVPVFRVEDGGMAPQMAEYVIHSLAGLARGFDFYTQQQGNANWSPRPATRYEDWPVGVMGLGQLGRHVARAVAALGYPVAGWARSPRQETGIQVFHGADQLNDFLARTRVLVNLLPLTPQTRGIIDRRLLNVLRPEAVIINIARGGHVVDADLLAALDAGTVQAAVLDVFNEEPLPPGHRYWSHPRVRVTPHIAAMTLEVGAAGQISQRIRSLEAGEPVSGAVRRDTGY